MLEALGKIPKGINLILFIWALVGLFLMLLDPKIKKGKAFFVSIIIICFMVFWRTMILISSRYALGLILPFCVLAAYLLYNIGKKRHVLVRLALYIAIAISGYIFLRMNIDSMFRNYSSDVISEIFKDIDSSRGKNKFVASWRDFGRVYYASRLDGSLSSVRDENIHDYVLNYREAYPDTIFNVELRTIADDDAVLEKLKHKQIASLIEDTRKHKKQLVFFLSTGDQCVPVSENRIPPYRPNLLENGDLERLDSPEESYAKLKSYNEEYAVSHDIDSAIRTPENAFFDIPSDLSSLPEVITQETGAIDGQYSVRIRSGADAAYLMFDLLLSNGNYDYSMLIKGETGTQVRIVYEACRDGNREIVPIATFTIPDKRLFQITTRLSVDDLKEEDCFRVGVSVQKGEAFLDDFSLTPSESAVSAPSDADRD